MTLWHGQAHSTINVNEIDFLLFNFLGNGPLFLVDISGNSVPFSTPPWEFGLHLFPKEMNAGRGYVAWKLVESESNEYGSLFHGTL